jgi:N6-adenosine-specific RNA methylase IME4
VVGKRGKIPTPRGARNVRQFLSEMRGKHSAKPNEIRTRIETMFTTQNKIELFARKKHEGWVPVNIQHRQTLKAWELILKRN